MLDIVETGSESKKSFPNQIKLLLIIFFIILIFCLAIYIRVQTKYADQIVAIDKIPNDYQTAMVFGAGLKARGVPGAVLEDRILTAIKIFQAGKVSQILMSGDNSSANHNEVQAMKNLATAEGVSEDVILMDHAGRSTLESCQDLKTEFELNQVILVTQKYHLKRALYVCNELGVQAIGVDAGARNYQKQLTYSLREVLASIIDWFELVFTK